MKTNRREFLKYAAAGLAMAGIQPSLLNGELSQDPANLTNPASAYSPLSDSDRQRYIDLAQFGRKKGASSSKGMVICSHPLATHEAVRVLQEGGNACDAVLTASLAQTVVEPHMTTITGVFSMLYYDAATSQTIHLNGSNNAPLAPLENFEMRNLVAELKTGRGVTTPGFWAGIEAALERFGTLPKKRIMGPAIHYAREGFEIHPFLYGEIFVQSELIGKSPQGLEIYFPDNALVRPGKKLYQHRAADALERLVEEGNDYFYHGEFAQKFSKVVQDAGGVITPADFEAYKVMWQEPAAGSYRGFDVIGSPPPDFGGSSLIELLNMIELMDLQTLGPPWESLETTWTLIRILNNVLMAGIMQRQTGKILPMEKSLSKEFAEQRFKSIKKNPGSLLPETPLPFVPPVGSNHITIVDPKGNVATVLHSCMSFPWSNGLFVDGISICAAGAHYAVGMPKPGERIHARICPSIIFKDKKPVLSSGSPSISLMQNVIQNTINILDFGLSCEDSVHKPRFGGSSLSVPGATLIETDMKPEIIQGIKAKKLRLDVVNPWNWHHGSFEGVYINPATGLKTACADPRRAGHTEGMT
jgi:gamma-glutamyltranspeptidase/glutathione hydrolase